MLVYGTDRVTSLLNVGKPLVPVLLKNKKTLISGILAACLTFSELGAFVTGCFLVFFFFLADLFKLHYSLT